METVESIFRWLHVVTAILWVGLLYFFNFVNGPFAATMDGETKKKVVPELVGRTLFWFRYGALYVWISGAMLVGMVFYHPDGMVIPAEEATMNKGAMFGLALAALLVLTMVYDVLAKKLLKGPMAFVGGWVLASGMLYAMRGLDFQARAWMIHLGALFGTIMFFNVWMRIWPAQRKIMAAIKAGEAPDGALVALAGLRSKHNTYMSFPLVLLMLNQHATWAYKPWITGVAMLGSWVIVWLLYQKASKVQGA